MKLVNPSFEIIEQKDLLKHIELCGRVCYKSEDKITRGSAEKFVNTLIKSGHTSVLEHGTVYLTVDPYHYTDLDFYQRNPYSTATTRESILYVTTNYRVLIENNRKFHLKDATDPTEYHKKRITVRFIINRAIANEFVRHRVFSFSQESSRYCDYAKGKFGSEVTFVIPSWFSPLEDCQIDYIDNKYFKANRQQSLKLTDKEKVFLESMVFSEAHYMNMLANKATPQEARDVLPLATKTELIMTGFASDWEDFFLLRCAQAAHPDARKIAISLLKEFFKRGYIYEYSRKFSKLSCLV